MHKLAAEGAPSETKTILGWHFNLRTLTVSLPNDKYKAWTRDILNLISTKKCTRKELEQLVGRLIHASTMIPTSRFFLGAFYKKIYRVKHDKSILHLNRIDLQLLLLWRSFLTKAEKGINLNLLSFRCPTNITLSDSCPTGMGGYSLKSGRAWRFDLSHTQNISNNYLEFLASVVTILIEHHNTDIPEFGNVLALTDNSSCVAWLHRNNFDAPAQPLPYEISTTLATCCLNNDFTIHPQHIKGLHNNVSDFLSRKFSMSNDTLTHCIHSQFHSQIPQNFNIYPIPPSIQSWICSTLALQPSSLTQEPNPPMSPPTEPGDAGLHFFANPDSSMTHSLIHSNTVQGPVSPSVSSNQSGLVSSQEPPFINQIQSKFLEGVLNKPLATWRRNSGVVVGLAPFTSRTAKTSSILKLPPCSKRGPELIQP